MPRVTTEQIFAAHFALVRTLQGTSWDGSAIPLVYSSRNWVKWSQTPEGGMPAHYQLDPREERDVRTGLGRSRRLLHAQTDIRISRLPQDQYPDVLDIPGNKGPFSTLVNNWVDNLYNLFSPADYGSQTLNGLVADCYPVTMRVDAGDDASRVAVIYCVTEIVTGG